jgi:hypothetical protein
VRQAFTGRLSQHRHSPLRVAANFDARGTVCANLRHWDPEAMRLVVERPLFFQRNTRRIPWEVVLVVDQSGSMVGSVIHSAVMAVILAGLPSYRLRLVVFDTNVVDLTDVAIPHPSGQCCARLRFFQRAGTTPVRRWGLHCSTSTARSSRSRSCGHGSTLM